jgi:hypothetical protein
VIHKLIGGLTAATIILAAGAISASANPLSDLDKIGQSNACSRAVSAMVKPQNTPAETYDTASTQILKCQEPLHGIPSDGEYSHTGWLLHMALGEESQADSLWASFLRTGNVDVAEQSTSHLDRSSDYLEQATEAMRNAP